MSAEERVAHAARALRALRAMERSFARPDGGYRRDGRLRRPGAAAHLWPFARALVAILDVAGIDPSLRPGLDVEVRIARAQAALERYWDEVRRPPAYSSDLAGARIGGDRYLDDNAWVGLALVELERLHPGYSRLDRAAAVFRFAQSAWDARRGGVFWVEQGRGLGQRNHDRNTVSTAPNAQLGLHLAELGDPPVGDPTPEEMFGWVLEALDASAARPAAGSGPFLDKVHGDGSVDRAAWSYNQGSMAGLAVLLARRSDADAAGHLRQAEAIAAHALDRLPQPLLVTQPAAFNAIFFRNLLLVHHASADVELRRRIRTATRDYAAWLWEQRRGRRDLVRPGGGAPTLLDQSAAVSLHALLAWEPAAYGRIA